MPQIRCPSCGTTINLENRKKIDMRLILRSLQSGPKTFTELLNSTRLPRKTLYLRLKELLKAEKVVKDGGYHLSKSLQESGKVMRGYELKSKISRFIRENPNGNRDTLIIIGLMAFVLLAPALFANRLVYAHQLHEFDLQPKGIGELFTVTISVDDAVDLYSWQGEITFDGDILAVSDVIAGDFLSASALVINATSGFSTADGLQSGTDSILIFAEETGSGSLDIGGSLLGQAPGKSGSGTLATIAFSVAADVSGSNEANLEGGILLLTPDVTDAEGRLSIEY